jgi:predicted CopG family antitoxin
VTKTISLSDETYNCLKKIKRKPESFSDVIMRLIGNKGGLTEILNLYPELKEGNDLEVVVEEYEKEFNTKQEKI